MSVPSGLNGLNSWIQRHPVKEPPAHLRAGYTDEVMRRLRALEAPRPVLGWLPLPRVSWALGTALACLLAGLFLWPSAPSRTIQRLEEGMDLLVEVGEGLDLAEADLEEELQALDELELVG